ncbi:hypothetical protein BOX15_Mlig000881g2, partial [Macrostomum lignano]
PTPATMGLLKPPIVEPALPETHINRRAMRLLKYSMYLGAAAVTVRFIYRLPLARPGLYRMFYKQK